MKFEDPLPHCSHFVHWSEETGMLPEESGVGPAPPRQLSRNSFLNIHSYGQQHAEPSGKVDETRTEQCGGMGEFVSLHAAHSAATLLILLALSSLIVPALTFSAFREASAVFSFCLSLGFDVGILSTSTGQDSGNMREGVTRLRSRLSDILSHCSHAENGYSGHSPA
ncbi:uncharacterized protein EV422DRAFT_508631 [Fimicolochytrium jonesii]|uniref:uncharacterized protein n=1 Tax=Fimicolochytrium jonesii TaxID=1396493 RepID=UPI0022FE39FA|nr:uncharacterized protein EV422DRAFT_508631 [Fimicolochytrium jonesii]KAI8817795.1 hypothetical protein EV422DRAFT_508631 [Fimicolochytrium jonesii]